MRRRATAFVLAMVASVVALTATPRQSSRPTRVISLVPAVTEMLFAVGAGAQVAGVSSFDTYPPEARKKPQVGALLNPDFERILSLKPDLVVVYGSQTELLGRLERMSIPTFVYRHAGLADVSTTISSLGARVGRSAEAAKVVRGLQTTLTAIRTSVAGRPRPRVALVFGREAGALRNIFVSGGIGFLHDLIETAGGLNAFADVRRESVQVSSEAMLTHAPDIIIETHQSSWDTSLTPREQAVWRALASVPAVRTNRIHIVADDRLFIPGPRVAEAARVLAGVVHPEIRIPQGTP
jgi:iron complex transport system substrate-binding protein